MGLPYVFVIGLLASAIRPRLPVIGADVRQIREPHSGETANAFDAAVVLALDTRLVALIPYRTGSHFIHFCDEAQKSG